MDELKNDIKSLIVSSLNLEVPIGEIDDEAPLFSQEKGGLGLDSIDALEIVVMLESEFGIKVKNESSARDSFKSISTLAEFVESKLAQPT